MSLSFLGLGAGCASHPANRNPVGEPFPSVAGSSLDGRRYRLPEDLAGKKVLLLVGYVMKAQFDLDRWILGILQADLPIQVYELPTIDGMIPGLFAGTIDRGMKKGIPEEDWGGVITVYRQAGKIAKFTGKESPRNARALLLDENGRVLWFHDRGYSPRLLAEIDERIRTSSP